MSLNKRTYHHPKIQEALRHWRRTNPRDSKTAHAIAGRVLREAMNQHYVDPAHNLYATCLMELEAEAMRKIDLLATGRPELKEFIGCVREFIDLANGRIATLEIVKRSWRCHYCLEEVHRFDCEPDDLELEESKVAMAALVKHSRQCEKNPIAKQLIEVVEELEALKLDQELDRES